ncbi:MAG: helix-turn-helix domain-containing protein [Candidatus Kapabacteria bacterium]|nr:helix-turn-helix domain-containing protein [Candidatus Kapabacteria bacterium]
MIKQILTSISPEELQELISAAVAKEFAKCNPTPIYQNDDLIKIPDVCKLFHVTKPTVHKYMNEGLFPTHRIGGRVFFKKSEVILALQKNKGVCHE